MDFENKLNEENNINDIFTLKHANFFENMKNNNNLDTFGSGGNIQQEKNENNLNNILSRQEKIIWKYELILVYSHHQRKIKI